MQPARLILKKEIWSRRTDGRIAIGVLLIIAALLLFQFFDARWLSRSSRSNTEAILRQAQQLRTASREEVEQEEALLKQHPFEVKGYTSRDERYERLADLLRFQQLTCRHFELHRDETGLRGFSSLLDTCKMTEHLTDNFQQALSKAPALQL